VLERFDLVEALRPSLVLLMLGTNDARSHGRGSSHRMVTPEETERNLRALIELVAVDLNAAVTVVTPPAVDPARVTGYFTGQPLRWEAATVAEVAAIVRAVAPDCLDLHTAMLEHGLDDLIEDDGVHPTIAGQRFILERVVAHLAVLGRRQDTP
jgi:lysophospholipase L1-like esterase